MAISLTEIQDILQLAFRVNRDGEISDDKENGKYVDFNYVKVNNETAIIKRY